MSNQKIEYLPWDSEFFGKKTGRFFADKTSGLVTVLTEAVNAGYGLIYVFGNENFYVNEKLLLQFNGHLACRKVLFEKEIKISKEPSTAIPEYNNNELTPELEQLAYESGKYSRFKSDKNFRKDDFFRMYRKWIENSIKKQIADHVFVAKENNSIKGMVTLKTDAQKGHIGLLSVLPETQGKGYGTALITACENELFRKGVFKLEVPTQEDNTQACNFYKKYGFEIKKTTVIYHFWLL